MPSPRKKWRVTYPHGLSQFQRTATSRAHALRVVEGLRDTSIEQATVWVDQGDGWEQHETFDLRAARIAGKEA